MFTILRGLTEQELEDLVSVCPGAVNTGELTVVPIEQLLPVAQDGALTFDQDKIICELGIANDIVTLDELGSWDPFDN